MSLLLSRRSFLTLSLSATGLYIGAKLLGANESYPNFSQETFQANAWIRVDPHNNVTFIIDKSEMGQGIQTSLAMLLAEELEVDLESVRTEFAPAAPIYANTLFRVQVTGGSTSIESSYDNLRTVAAATRMLFIQAAAKQWQLPVTECYANQARVFHAASNQSVNYGDLLALAAEESLDTQVVLKTADEYKILGTPKARLDIPAKVDGSAIFGIDITLDNMLNATIKHPPVFGSELLSFDDSAARSIKGVKDIFAIPSGVVVVADTFWHAKKAADLLRIQWTEGNSDINSASIQRSWFGHSQGDASSVESRGNAEDILDESSNQLTAIYELPYQAHATMEPMNCTVHLQQERCDVWVGTQAQGPNHEAVVKLTGLEHEQVHIHTTYLGGGFGRRGEVDFVVEAVQIAQHFDVPVKLIWSRDEDMQHDYYRPASYHVISAALQTDSLQAWRHRIIGPSIMQRVAPGFVPAAMPQWLPTGLKSFAAWVTGGVVSLINDPTLIEGAKELAYKTDNLEIELSHYDPGIPIGFWRSVGHSSNAFVVESFIDELAHQAEKDPYEFRLQLLENKPRHLGVLNLAAEKSGWGSELPPGEGRGIAVHHSFNCYVAQVAEVRVLDNGRLSVNRVVCAIDCGAVINPDTVVAQVEGAIAFGLTAAIKSAITIKDGKVEQSNFHDFHLLRIDEMPSVEVYLIDSPEPPTGVGEPAVPVIAPAVSNAIFAASNRRIRKLPIRPEDLR
ncbi:MAG: xanthine dehydrogenase family protein molybdopterin-binding subunit [Gammaproteobacteria bacterium]|nr:xanthine dehydrogenase family protein molybdopterin-binding subunit [Gammaproteobacteria bacterium]